MLNLFVTLIILVSCVVAGYALTVVVEASTLSFVKRLTILTFVFMVIIMYMCGVTIPILWPDMTMEEWQSTMQAGFIATLTAWAIVTGVAVTLFRLAEPES